MLFQAQERQDRSPWWLWFPISAGLVAAAITALVFCPVPRSEPVPAPMALFLAVAYVGLAGGVGATVLAVSGVLVARRQSGLPIRAPFSLFCSVAAWIAPMTAFYRRNSMWAAYTACVVSTLVATLIYRHRLCASAPATTASVKEGEEDPPNRRHLWLKFAAVLLQFSILAMLASMTHSATVLLGAAVFIVVWCYQGAVSTRSIPSRYKKSSYASMAVALAAVFVAASLTPYLAVHGEDESAEGVGLSRNHSVIKSGRESSEQKADLLQIVKSLFLKSGGEHPGTEKRIEHAHTSADSPYPVLQALFGDRKPALDPSLNSGERKRKYRTTTSLAPSDSYPGMILRPLIEDHSPIVPPVARRTVLQEKSNTWKDAPVSIPFYGAYWFFRASDGTLPADSVESRGDPATMSFKTTDFSPIAMEARQSFGTLIDLSCCRLVELTISNGDRRPATVAVELILTNTRLPGKPQQSLGMCAVNSTQRWSPDDNRPPVTETLTFRVPPHSAIQNFDEATIRFQMGSPRERWSAKMAILKFRLIPHGL